MPERREPTPEEAARLKSSDEYKRRIRQYIGHPCRVCGEVFGSFRAVERAVTMTQDNYLFLAHADCYNNYVAQPTVVSEELL